MARLLGHRTDALKNRPLGDVLKDSERTPERLSAVYRTWEARPVAGSAGFRRATELSIAVSVARAPSAEAPDGESAGGDGV